MVQDKKTECKLMAHSRHSKGAALKKVMPRYRAFSASFSNSKIAISEQMLFVVGEGWVVGISFKSQGPGCRLRERTSIPFPR